MVDDKTFFRVGFDDETVAMLIELSEATHCPPAILAASIVRCVLVDDLAAHGGKVHADTPENDPLFN
jgi:hypothetical protein